MDDNLIHDEPLAVNHNFIAETAASLKSPQLQQITQTFRDSNDIVRRLLALPLTLLTIGETGKTYVAFLAEAMILSKRIQAGDHSDEAVAEAHDQARRRQREVDENSNLDPVKSAGSALRGIVKLDILKRPIQALFYSCA